MAFDYQAHAAEQYRTALARVLAYKQAGRQTVGPDDARTARLDAHRALEKAALDYAGTHDGPARLRTDIADAEHAADFELAALLTTALRRGGDRRTVGREIHHRLETLADTPGTTGGTGTPAPSSPTGPADRQPPRRVLPGLRDWRPDIPVWPNSDDTDDALRHTRANLDDPNTAELVRRAHRDLFRRAWVARFTAPDGTVRYPREEREGWTWRAESTTAARTQLSGAYPVAAADLIPGALVHTGTVPEHLATVTDLTPGPDHADGPTVLLTLAVLAPGPRRTVVVGPLPAATALLVLPNGPLA